MYYIQVSKTSNIQVIFESDIVHVTDSEGNIRPKISLGFGPTNAKILQDESKPLNLDLTIWVGMDKKVTQKFVYTIPIPNILDCIEMCVVCNDTMQEKNKSASRRR